MEGGEGKGESIVKRGGSFSVFVKGKLWKNGELSQWVFRWKRAVVGGKKGRRREAEQRYKG